jgi:hypothetical protein
MRLRVWALWALLPAALSGQGAPLYRVAGVVVNSQTGAPVAKARATVSRSGSTETLVTTVTGADGKFAFDLPEGKYVLDAGPRDLAEVFGRRGPDIGAGSLVITGPGQNTANLLFRWYPPAAISGKIVDQYGDPVQSALVQLVRSSVVAGRRRVVTAAWDRTNDLGEYRFGPIHGGSFYLAVTGQPWYSGTGSDGREKVAYIPVYYPNAADPAQAALLAVPPGEEARADFSLATTPGATLTIKSDVQPAQQCTMALATEGVGGAQGDQQTLYASALTVVRALPPGAYTVHLHCSGAGSDLRATRSIQVNGADVTVELALLPDPTVSGTVQLKNPAARPRGSILAALVREDNGRAIATAIGPNGAFRFPAVAPGRYLPQIHGTDGYFASEIHVEGTDFRDGVVELEEGQSVTLRMVASDEIGRVKGFAVRGDQPTEGVFVILAPTADSAIPLPAHAFQTESDGSFDWPHIPAGDYKLFAVEDVGIEYANPATIKPYLGGGKAIRVEAHGAYSERIPLSPAAN